MFWALLMDVATPFLLACLMNEGRVVARVQNSSAQENPIMCPAKSSNPRSARQTLAEQLAAEASMWHLPVEAPHAKRRVVP
jgi:hypothetical protein